MKYWIGFIVMGFAFGCGSSESASEARAWSFSEPVPYYEEPEEWWGDDHMPRARRPRAERPVDCAFFRNIPVDFKLNMREVHAEHRIRSPYWVSLGGPLADPTRHWFQCDQKQVYSLDGTVADVRCPRPDGLRFGLQGDHISGLPQWLVDHINWEYINEYWPWRTSDSTVTHTLTIPIRFYVRDTQELIEAKVVFSYWPRNFATDSPEEPLMPDRPLCIRTLNGAVRDVVDLTPVCGTQTWCPSPFESP